MKFYGQQVYLGPADKETLYWLVNESEISEPERARLKAKLSSEFLSDETYRQAMRQRKLNGIRRAKRMKKLEEFWK